MASDYRACKHCPQIIPYNFMMFCCECLFPFHIPSACRSINWTEIFPSVVNASALVKLYYFITFVNVGNGITGVELVLINFMMSAGSFKFSSTWVMINSLNSMNWTFFLISVGDSNTFKLSFSPVKLLLWCWIDFWLSPTFFWLRPLVWRRFSPFTRLVSLPPWFSFTW